MKMKLTASCSCRHCPMKAERLHISRDLITRLSKALSGGALHLEETGEVLVEKNRLDTDLEEGLTRPPDAEIDKRPSRVGTAAGSRVGTAAGRQSLASAGPHALLLTIDHARKASSSSISSASERAVDVLARFYNARKGNRTLLDHLCISSDNDYSNPTTFLEHVVRQLASINGNGAERAARLLRKMLHESPTRRRISCLLWRKDGKYKQYTSVHGLCYLIKTARTPHIQEDAIRVLAAGSTDPVWLEQLHKIKGLVKVLIDAAASGTEKTSDTAVWLLWRMTEHDDCCKLVFEGGESSMKKLLELAAPEESTSSNRENALGALANLSSCDAAALFSLAHTQIFEVAQKALSDGSDRAIKNAAILIGNLSFDETLFPWLSEQHFDLSKLSLLVREGDEVATEYGLMSVSNLCRMESHAQQTLADGVLLDALMAMRAIEAGFPPVIRALAERAITNIQIHRWKGSGALVPAARRRALGRADARHAPSGSTRCGALGSSWSSTRPFRSISDLTGSRCSSYTFPALDRSWLQSRACRSEEEEGRASLPDLVERSSNKMEEWLATSPHSSAFPRQVSSLALKHLGAEGAGSAVGGKEQSSQHLLPDTLRVVGAVTPQHMAHADRDGPASGW